jgi:hypothetical protein
MIRSGRRARGRRFACALLVAGGLAAPLLADVYQDRRVEAGLKIFRALLAADLDLEKKTVDEGRLLVVFFYTDERKRADDLAKAFGSEPIHGLPLATEETSDAGLPSYDRRTPAAIFLAQPPDAETLRTLVKYGIAHHVIVYSPFEGHVESGVLGGLVVEAQVRPYINQATLVASHLNLKEFFLKVTKVFR